MENVESPVPYVENSPEARQAFAEQMVKTHGPDKAITLAHALMSAAACEMQPYGAVPAGEQGSAGPDCE